MEGLECQRGKRGGGWAARGWESAMGSQGDLVLLGVSVNLLWRSSESTAPLSVGLKWRCPAGG